MEAISRSDPRPAESDRRRLLDAARRCVARWGVAKTTLEDVAREASCSRATVYRAFPGGKDAVLGAVLLDEQTTLLAAIAVAVADADDLEGALTATLVAIGRHLAGSDAFQFLLEHEPGLVLPHLAFRPLDGLLGRVQALGGPLLHDHLDPVEAARVVEWLARLVISFTCSPSPAVDLTDPASVRSLVRTHVLPGIPVPIVN